MKIRNILTVSCALCLGMLSGSAQNLDPTVVVNQAYEGKLFQVHKPSIEMAVPDSLTRFELDFDYLVFEKPYKGSGGFSPYVLTMKPVPTVEDSRQLYLNVGARYALHPTLDLVWSPFRGHSFKMDVYAMHRSYVGRYERWSEDEADWKGYDLMSEAGVNGRYEASSMSAGFDVSYFGLASEDPLKKRTYDAMDVRLGLTSKPAGSSYFRYDVQASYRYAKDRFAFTGADKDWLSEHLVELDAVLGQVFDGGHKILCDVNVDVAAYSHCDFASATGHVALVPRYVLARERWAVDAGVRIAKVIRSNSSDKAFASRDQIVYPEVKAWLSILPDAMRLYAYIGGGNKLNTYASLLEKNHHTDPGFGLYGHDLLDVTVERVSTSIGLEGRIGSKFSYDVRTGYVCYANDLLEAVAVVPTENVENAPSYLPGIGYASYQKYYAAADLRFETDPFRIDGSVVYTSTWDMKDAEGLFAPAALKGEVSAEYNWKRRLYAGVDCGFSTPRKSSGMDFRIPGYVDLGIYCEYALNRKLSFWARGGNLLNMTIQRNPLYAEKGVAGTVGICLNL